MSFNHKNNNSESSKLKLCIDLIACSQTDHIQSWTDYNFLAELNEVRIRKKKY